MALLLEEEKNYSNEDERINKAKRADTCRNLKKHIPLAIVAKFGCHVLHHLASSLSNLIRQIDRQAD